MRIQSFAFNNKEPLPPRFRGVSPPLDITDVPKEAKSLVLIMHDPDAVSGDYIHWAVWDIDPTTTEVLEGAAPSGSTEGVTTAGTPGYVGPRPPRGSGTHRYTFELYALDAVLDLLPATPPDALLKTVQKHLLAIATLVGMAYA